MKSRSESRFSDFETMSKPNDFVFFAAILSVLINGYAFQTVNGIERESEELSESNDNATTLSSLPPLPDPIPVRGKTTKVMVGKCVANVRLSATNILAHF